jgi:hypothetical protein
MARYKIPVHVDGNREIILEYLGIDPFHADWIIVTDDQLNNPLRNTGTAVRNYFNTRGGMVKLPRELCEPPERYGPYRPIAKALP